MHKGQGKEDLLDVLKKVASGELTAEAAEQLLSEKHRRDRPSRPRKAVADHPLKKSKRGRPYSKVREENWAIILMGWILFHDKLPKMKLRKILANCLHVEEWGVSRAIARINQLERRGCLIGRTVVNGVAMIIALSPNDVIALSPNEYILRSPLLTLL